VKRLIGKASDEARKRELEEVLKTLE